MQPHSRFVVKFHKRDSAFTAWNLRRLLLAAIHDAAPQPDLYLSLFSVAELHNCPLAALTSFGCLPLRVSLIITVLDSSRSLLRSEQPGTQYSQSSGYVRALEHAEIVEQFLSIHSVRNAYAVPAPFQPESEALNEYLQFVPHYHVFSLEGKDG